MKHKDDIKNRSLTYKNQYEWANISVNSLLIFLVLFISLFGRGKFKNYGLYITLLPVIPFAVKLFIKNFLSLKYNVYFRLWTIFTLFIGISEIVNLNFPTFIILFLFPFILIYLFNDILEGLLSLALGLFPFVLMALLAIFLGNKFTSNSIGLYISAFFVVITALVIINNSIIVNVFYITGSFVTVKILFEINSRTSQLVFLSTILFYIIFLFIDIIKNNYQVIKNNKIVLLILSALFIIISIVVFKKIFNSIISTKWRPNDISTGRFEIWKTTFEHASYWGHSYDWYESSGLFQTYGPHNFFVGVLGYNGLISFYVSIFIFIYFLIYNSAEIILKKNKLKILTLFFLVTALAKGIPESLLINSVMAVYTWFIYIFVACNYNINDENLDLRISKHKYIYIFMFTSIFITIYISVFDANISNLFDLIKKYV